MTLREAFVQVAIIVWLIPALALLNRGGGSPPDA